LCCVSENQNNETTRRRRFRAGLCGVSRACFATGSRWPEHLCRLFAPWQADDFDQPDQRNSGRGAFYQQRFKDIGAEIGEPQDLADLAIGEADVAHEVLKGGEFASVHTSPPGMGPADNAQNVAVLGAGFNRLAIGRRQDSWAPVLAPPGEGDTVLRGKLVISLASAVLGIRGMSLSLAVLRGALIRTGIGALIVGAGELLYWFGRLVKGAGGFGKAMSLLKNVAVEV